MHELNKQDKPREYWVKEVILLLSSCRGFLLEYSRSNNVNIMEAHCVKTKRKYCIKDYIPVIIMAVCIITALIIAYVKGITMDDIYTLVEGNRLQAVIIILLIFALKGVVAVIWYAALVAVSGYVFGLADALIVNSIGTVLCLSVSYGVGYFTKSDFVRSMIAKNKRISKYFDKYESNSFLISYLLHAMGLSTEVLGLMFGFMKMPYIKYVLSSFIAMLPGMVCITIFGERPDFASPAFWIAVAVEAAVIVTAYIYSKKVLN